MIILPCLKIFFTGEDYLSFVFLLIFIFGNLIKLVKV